MESNGKQAFDPARHLSKVSGRDYLEVRWRLVWLRAQHPDASVETRLHTLDMESETAVFQATVTLPSGASATGWGMESGEALRQSNSRITDWLEKAETKALGRALGALGFGTQFTDDYGDAVVDAPQGQYRNDYPGQTHASPTGPTTTRREAPAGSGEATPRQIKYLHAVAREAGISGDELETRSQELFGQGLDALGRRDISRFIEQIQSERNLAGVPS